MRYATAAAFRQALDDRLKTEASRTGLPLARLRKQVAFELFLRRLVQYTGRLMRAHEGKATIRVYDYADVRVPVLRAMHARRLTTYKTLGFTREQQTTLTAAAA